ncbi:MAG: 4-hydroxythreonine-4-phosphate dehydrogenase PdxA [Calditrichia bacterium]|nr:4-hydroxythreonine-4-phosphate dehydrogenase PdxA [Calditrichia bacterium]
MKPKFAITIGDPNGIGPEIVLKSFLDKNFIDNAIPVVIAEPAILQFYINLFSYDLEIEEYTEFSNIQYKFGSIPCFPVTPMDYKPQPGLITADAGIHAFKYIKKAIEFANKSLVDGIITAPINKEALKLANIPYMDHTEILTKLTKSENILTLFVTRNLKIFFYSRHIEFRKIADALEVEKIVSCLKTCISHLNKLGIINPHIALAALNPHGGEHGMFGKEEIEILEPAVKKAQQLNLKVSGPIPADSVFHLAKEGVYDAVLSLYHDQGHIAAKTYDFYKTVSITTGLPFIRTSVDHGTAMDIAGEGIAKETSLIEAFKCAAKYYW